MSLKEILHNLIKQRGEVTYGEVCQVCAEEGYKVDTATRRLREMTDIEPVMGKSKRGTNYIKAYKWIGRIPGTFGSLEEVRYIETNTGLFTYKIDPKHASTFNPPD